MNPAVAAAAVALELASCLSFVSIFRLFFRPIPRSGAREMAWSQMGSGALLPGGGVGSLAVGGWLLHVAGMPTRQIVQRSSGLFFLTSAINVLTLAAAGLVLLLGIGDGPQDVLRAGLPVMAAVTAIILVLGLPKVTHRVSERAPPGGLARRRRRWHPRRPPSPDSAQLAPRRRPGLFAVRHRRAVDDIRRHRPAAARGAAHGRLPSGLSPQCASDPRWHRGPRRRPRRRPRALRIARVSRRRRRARLPRNCLLGPNPRRVARLRSAAAAPGSHG
jgi:hypothetical protein